MGVRVGVRVGVIFFRLHELNAVTSCSVLLGFPAAAGLAVVIENTVVELADMEVTFFVA